MNVFDDDGHELDAEFAVEKHQETWSVVLESRGGRRGTPGVRNAEYTDGLGVLLRRLAQQSATLTDAIVETGVLQEADLGRQSGSGAGKVGRWRAPERPAQMRAIMRISARIGLRGGRACDAGRRRSGDVRTRHDRGVAESYKLQLVSRSPVSPRRIA